MRTCNFCGETKALDEFPPSGGGYRRRKCRACYAPISREKAAAYHALHRERRLTTLRDRYEQDKVKVLAHYGSRCACCSEGELLFLTIDHIDNGGYRFRKKNNGSSHNNIYRWLVRNGFPDGYQVLCVNCNQGKHRNGGVCPHVSRRFNDQSASS